MKKKGKKKSAAKRTGTRSLDALRRRLDAVDADLLESLSERTRLVLEVRKAKQEKGGRIWVPEREAAQLDRLLRLNAQLKTPVPEEALRAVFAEVLSSSRSLQGKLRVAYLGPEGTYSERAAGEQFGSQAELVAVPTLPDVFDAVEKRQVDLGVVPFENSTEGIVGQALDSFVDSALRIVGERQVEIRHSLLSNADSVSQVRRVMAHPQALAQCRNWLSKHLPRAELREVSSNAAAAAAAGRTRTSAAIAGIEASRRYGLGVLEDGIQDLARNVTRFIFLGHEEQASVGEGDKISILFSVRNEAGVLAKILTPLARAGIDVIKIESRPKRGALWDYIFFVDLRGNPKERSVGEALEAMRKHCVWVKILGCYATSASK